MKTMIITFFGLLVWLIAMLYVAGVDAVRQQQARNEYCARGIPVTWAAPQRYAVPRALYYGVQGVQE